jgi:NADPH:quinone reductase-like Zn-dependent oxidoreductase
MKAVIFRQHGGPDVLDYADVPDPSPGTSEILVRVKACALNHLDLWIRQGIPAYTIPLPHISGCDVAGVVERIGAEVTAFRVGDRVVLAPGLSCGQCPACQSGRENLCASYGIRGAMTDGGYAELTTARVSDAIRLPADLSFEDAAACPLVFVTAWHMLVTRTNLQAGETVLVQAAGSGVGHAAVQIARHLKATVYATVGSDAKIPKAKALGADEVINYQLADVEERVRALTQQRGVDVVFEHIGPEVWDKSLRVLAKGGRLVTCGATSGPSVSVDLRHVFSRELSILGAIMGTRADLDAVTQLVFSKHLKPVVDSVFPLREARAAQERMLARDVFGKLVLQP